MRRSPLLISVLLAAMLLAEGCGTLSRLIPGFMMYVFGKEGMVLDYDKKTGTFTFIHASCSEGIEIQRSSADYYARRYIGARRILDE